MTGRPRRCGWFDAVAMRRAKRLCGFDSIALTKLDVLSGLRTIKVCVGYEVDGKELDDVPALAHEFEKIVPRYVEFDGWSDAISTARTWEDLPTEAQQYLAGISQMLDCPISIVSVSPDRVSTIVTEHAQVLRSFVG